MAEKSEYRTRLYERYATICQGKTGDFDIAAAQRWGRAYDSYLSAWLPTDKNAAILDVACGSGMLLHFFKERGYTNISGVDLSPEQIQLARQVTTNISHGNCVEYLNARPQQFDLITGLDIVEHFKKDEVLDFLDACFSAIKPGGRLILQTPNAESPWAGHHRYNDLTHELGFQTHSATCLLKVCGFEQISARELGPVAWGYSLKSTIRYIAWQFIRLRMKIFNAIETGSPGSGIFTRIFMISAIKPGK